MLERPRQVRSTVSAARAVVRSKSPLHQPHDHLSRLVRRPEETAAFLRARLPDSHLRGFLWSSLRRAPAPSSTRICAAPSRPAVRSAQRAAGTAAAPRQCT